MNLLLVQNAKGKVLSHVSGLDSVDDDSLQSVTEINQLLVSVNFSSLDETSGPGEDGSNGVGGGELSLLVSSEMSGDSSVSGFGFITSVRGDQN